jgi:cytochrome b6-f complex iron-sulfur subunit
LAAARAGKAAGAAPAAAAPAAKPAAKPAGKAAVASAAATDGPKLSVEEMLAAVRPAPAAVAEPKATPVLAPAAKVAPPAPVRPSAKPAAAKPGAKGAAGETRRGFLGTIAATLASPFVIAWTALTASAGFAGLGLARFMLPNVLTEPPSKFKIGPPTDYDLGTVATKWVAQFGIWIVHTDQYRSQNLIYALASVCTHLGCTPSWLEGERKFKCPCHGSGFYITGINFEGPAPRPLERVGIRLAEDGMLEVDKSVKFQEEMGQWNDAASFFEVTA